MKTIIKVTLNGETQYMTPEAYSHYRLTLSSGDFGAHTTKEIKKLPKGVWSALRPKDINPRVLYPTVESIIEAYNHEDERAENYSESEDSPLAEFVSSFFYGKVSLAQILKSARLEDDTVDLMKTYESQAGMGALIDVLKETSELELADMFYQDGELLSAHIGEQEHQVDEYLSAAYQTLTPEEKERVQKESSAGILSSSLNNGEFIYTCADYSRWIMVADENKLKRKLKRLIKTSPRVKGA